MSLGGVTEKPHFDRLAFSVARTFATFANADEVTSRAALKDAWNNSHKKKT